MLTTLKRWWQDRIARKSWVTDEQLDRVISKLPLLDRLTDEEFSRLRRLTKIFLHKKKFSGAHGFDLTRDQLVFIALQACLPILYLGIEWYDGWSSIVIYPSGFTPERDMMDEYGVVHKVKSSLSGEAWQRGPVVLSWEGAKDGARMDGSNLVIHEFVHKLDMLNGSANGFPPIHGNMSRVGWTESFATAYSDFQDKAERGIDTGIDSYGASSPAEFIAVLSEVFFERPGLVNGIYPAVYENLCSFYCQNPLSGMQ